MIKTVPIRIEFRSRKATYFLDIERVSVQPDGSSKIWHRGTLKDSAHKEIHKTKFGTRAEVRRWAEIYATGYFHGLIIGGAGIEN